MQLRNERRLLRSASVKGRSFHIGTTRSAKKLLVLLLAANSRISLNNWLPQLLISSQKKCDVTIQFLVGGLVIHFAGIFHLSFSVQKLFKNLMLVQW
jgi:hypothetical protein